MSTGSLRMMVAAGVLAAGAALSAAAAPAASADVAPQACGWDPDGPSGQAYYNHCVPLGGPRVWIRVEEHNGPGFDKCAVPGQNPLGPTSRIKYAWYKGQLC